MIKNLEFFLLCSSLTREVSIVAGLPSRSCASSLSFFNISEYLYLLAEIADLAWLWAACLRILIKGGASWEEINIWDECVLLRSQLFCYFVQLNLQLILATMLLATVAILPFLFT